MAIREFVKNAGEKILPSKSGSSSSGSSSGPSGSSGSRQQQQDSSSRSPSSVQQASGSRNASSSSASAGSGSSGGRQQQQSSPATGQQGSGAGTQSRAPQTGEGGQSDYERQAQDAILQHLKNNVTDTPEDLTIIFDEDEGAVILMGTVPDDATAEVIIVTAGNIEGVCEVDDRMTRGRGNGKSSSGSAGSSGSRGSQSGSQNRSR
jgi:hypothetical protein